MSASDYTCATYGCGKPAIAVRQTSKPCAFYGVCAEHVRPLNGDGDSWLWAPPMVRRCRICTQEVTSSDPTVDYCRWCYYGGCIFGEEHKDLIEAIHETCRYSRLVADVAAYHTGGGCFVIQVTFVGDRTDYVWLSEAEDYVGDGVDPNSWVIGHYPDDSGDDEGRFDGTPRTVTDAAAHVLLHAITGW